MTGQSVFKHFLTEGDRFLVSKFSKLEDQGGYAVASNYGWYITLISSADTETNLTTHILSILFTKLGSLVARIGFQPVEETSRIYFSKLLSSKDEGTTTSSDEKEKNISQAASVAHTVLLLYTHLGIFFLAFGPPYIPTLLSFILPRRYLTTSAPRVLQAYCAYLPVMALNGFLEAFMASTARPADLAAQSRFMALCSVLFIATAVVLSEVVGLQETGMVYANVLNLGLRAAYGWRFMRQYFLTESRSSSTVVKPSSTAGDANSPLHARQCIPPTLVWISSVCVGLLVRLSSVRYGGLSAGITSKAAHIGVGGVLFAAWAFIW